FRWRTRAAARDPRCRRRSGPRSGDQRGIRSSRSNRPGSVTVLLFAEPFGIGAAGDAAVRAQRTLGDEEDDPTLVEDSDAHPGPESESLPGTPRQHELKLAGERHGFHRLTKMLSIPVA